MVLLRKIFFVTFVAALSSGNVLAQFDSTVRVQPKPTGFFEPSESAKNLSKIERIGYVCGTSLAFSLFDYIGYNLVRVDNKAPAWYRVLQSGIQTALTYFLFKQCGLNSAISFTLIWWTWGDDLGYYGWANLADPPSPIEGVTWAWWTPIGLTRKKSAMIDSTTLIIQAMVGFSISIAIL